MTSAIKLTTRNNNFNSIANQSLDSLDRFLGHQDRNDRASMDVSQKRNSLHVVGTLPAYAIDIPGKSAHTSGLSRLRTESTQFPEWFDELDVIDIESCSQSDFSTLFVSAPTQFTQGMLYGKMTLRIHNAVFTGREAPSHGDALTAQMREHIRSIDSKMIALSETFPEWFAEFDMSDPDFCDRLELEEMMLSAPVSFAEGMLFGKLATRIQMASMTGLAFA